MSKLFYKIVDTHGVRDYFEAIMPTTKIAAFLKENNGVEIRRYEQ